MTSLQLHLLEYLVERVTSPNIISTATHDTPSGVDYISGDNDRLQHQRVGNVVSDEAQECDDGPRGRFKEWISYFRTTSLEHINKSSDSKTKLICSETLVNEVLDKFGNVLCELWERQERSRRRRIDMDKRIPAVATKKIRDR